MRRYERLKWKWDNGEYSLPFPKDWKYGASVIHIIVLILVSSFANFMMDLQV